MRERAPTETRYEVNGLLARTRQSTSEGMGRLTETWKEEGMVSVFAAGVVFKETVRLCERMYVCHGRRRRVLRYRALWKKGRSVIWERNGPDFGDVQWADWSFRRCGLLRSVGSAILCRLGVSVGG